jgi:hypothetical protein
VHGDPEKANPFTYTVVASIYDLLRQAGREGLIAGNKTTQDLAYRLWLTDPLRLKGGPARVARDLQDSSLTLPLDSEMYAYYSDEENPKLQWSSKPPQEWRSAGLADGFEKWALDIPPKKAQDASGQTLDVNQYLLNPCPSPDFNCNGFVARGPNLAQGAFGPWCQVEPAIFKADQQGSFGVTTDWGVFNRLFNAKAKRSRLTRAISHDQETPPVDMIWEVLVTYGSAYNGNLADIKFQERLDSHGDVEYQYPL